MLGLPNKMPHADFMTRYSIIAPKIFADMASDAKGCATKALPASGLDIDDFRCGHTKVRSKTGVKCGLDKVRLTTLDAVTPR